MSELVARLTPRRKHGRRIWRLERPMVMQGIEIPAGYETDLLSVRTWQRLLLTDYEQAIEASVLHDYLYDYPSLRTRAEVDGLFLREMTERGVGRYSRTIMWLGVRLGGWRKWRILGRAA